VLLNLGDHVDGDALPGGILLDVEGLVDGRDGLVELDVNDRTHDLDHTTDVLWCHLFYLVP
jgi:hypothetical protein